MNAQAIASQVDHLVVVADTLEQGVQWCEATLGVTPGPGGDHPQMGTHNRLLRIATVDYPRAYLEIIAIDWVVARAQPVRSRRWFDMDDARLRSRVRQEGPQLVHFVANLPDAGAGVAALAAVDIDRGDAIPASRMTPRGLLQWRITVRGDGRRLYDGCLPTLIEWGDAHPAGSLPSSGVTLQSLAVTHPQAAALGAAYGALGLHGVALAPGPANLCAKLLTPRGCVQLESKGI